MSLPRPSTQLNPEYSEELLAWFEAIDENNNQLAYLAASEFIENILCEEGAPKVPISSECSIAELTELTLGEEIVCEESASSESSSSDLFTNSEASISEELFQKCCEDIKFHLPRNSKDFGTLNKLLNLIIKEKQASTSDFRMFSALIRSLSIGLRNALIKIILLKERFDIFTRYTENYLNEYLIANKNCLAEVLPVVWSVYADETNKEHPYLNKTKAARLINAIINPIVNYLSELSLAQAVPYLLVFIKKRKYDVFEAHFQEKIRQAIKNMDPEINVFVEKIIQWINTHTMQLYKEELKNYVENSDSLELKKAYDEAYGRAWQEPKITSTKRKRTYTNNSVQPSVIPFAFVNGLGTPPQPTQQSVLRPNPTMRL